MLMTAAGTIPPAKVLVLGAGVAGLQALATARRLGAQTTGYDVRPEVAEQVQSLGAQFLDLGIEAAGEGGYARELTDEERARQQQALTDAIKGFDVVITTALVPGPPGAAARHRRGRRGHEARQRDRRPGRRERRQLRADRARRRSSSSTTSRSSRRSTCPPTMPEHASQLYARNVQSLLELILGEDGRAGAGLRRRDRRRRLRHARRRDRPRGRQADRGGHSLMLVDEPRDPRAGRLRRLRGDLQGARTRCTRR